ncbi:MAG TPA: TerC family protein, partial [Vicinamibacteria bacterium]|nr:TerC family protein [Vicinamibacteria bacterium]
MDWIGDPNAWLGLLTLTVLEIVLGIDNVVFISILADRLPAAQADRARKIGLLLAMVARIALLFSISWLIRLTAPLFSLLGQEISGRDLVLIAGGLFLLAKSTYEIHDKLEGGHADAVKKVAPSMAGVLIQITLLDLVFSLDSVITAVGMVDRLAVMVIAVMVAVAFMLVFAGAISRFVN